MRSKGTETQAKRQPLHSTTDKATRKTQGLYQGCQVCVSNPAQLLPKTHGLKNNPWQ